MIKSFLPATCAFDCEWVPCPDTSRRLLSLPSDCSDREAIEAVWHAYAKEEGERPFLKLVLCKVVTIAAVFRAAAPEGHVVLELFSEDCNAQGEAHLITSFLERVAGGGLQLWGFNSASADLPILKQRAMALDAPLPKFSRRPAKPWEGMDYHDARNSDAHIDILEHIGAFGAGASKPKLHELAVACGLPGKVDVAGDEVAEMYLDGRLAEIREYNETDAVTTHLLMLRLAHVAGLLSEDPYCAELLAVEKLVQEQMAAGKLQFTKFWEAWKDGSGGVGSTKDADQTNPAPDGEVLVAQLRLHWKEIVAEVKADHSIQLAAALQSVRGVGASGAVLTLYFGNNDYARGKCKEQERYLAEAIAQALHMQALTLTCTLGDKPPA